MTTRALYLHHVTLTTGHVRRSPRSEVSDEALAACERLLADMLRGGTPEALSGSGVYLSGGQFGGRCLLAVARASAGEPLVTLGIGGHSRCGSALWRHLGQSGAPCPPEPWCAARIEPGLAARPDAAAWLGDLERCIAWAWIERTP